MGKMMYIRNVCKVFHDYVGSFTSKRGWGVICTYYTPPPPLDRHVKGGKEGAIRFQHIEADWPILWEVELLPPTWPHRVPASLILDINLPAVMAMIYTYSLQLSDILWRPEEREDHSDSF